MIIGERLKGVLKQKKITAKSFSEMTGVSEGMIYKYYKMDTVDTATLGKWAEALKVPIMAFMSDNTYKQVVTSPIIVDVNPEQKNNTLKVRRRLLYATRYNRTVCCDDTPTITDSNDGPTVNMHNGVPYYNVDFIGGFDIVLNDQTTKPEYLIDFKKYNEATCWCNVTGHSMEPEITHGDIIALKKIEDISFLPFGEVYAIITTNGMRTIKRLGPAQTPDHYSLIPTNKSSEYGVQEIPKSMVQAVYQVLGCMKRL